MKLDSSKFDAAEPNATNLDVVKVEIRTGCRLHFGLLELCSGVPNCFGGLGVMLAEPGYRLRVSAKDGRPPQDKDQVAVGHDGGIGVEWTAGFDPVDEERAKVQQVVSRRAQELNLQLPRLNFEMVDRLPLHSGLGAGTQLSVAAATAIELLRRHRTGRCSTTCELPRDWDAEQLADWSGRGLRSAIGLQGFLSGGLVFDLGRTDVTGMASRRSVQCQSHCLPSDWRIVIVRPKALLKVFGEAESKAMERLGRDENPNRERMLELANIVWGSAGGDCDFLRFTDALSEYMRLAADLFWRLQGGSYNGPDVSQAAELLHQAGLRAVGQSSWGPTVFGFAPDPDAAARAFAGVQSAIAGRDWSSQICQAAEGGATWSIVRPAL